MTLQSKLVIRAALLILLVGSVGRKGFAQNCNELKATYKAFESRCTATGSLQVTATGGSANYNYKMAGPTTVDYTSSNVITGLQPGTYTLTVRDIKTNCTVTVNNVVIPGSYVEPRFGLTETDVTCMNGNDGTVSVTGLQNGRQPFSYKIVTPSTSGIGTSNTTGLFTGLVPGSYSIQLTDSCGGIQTRSITIQNYTWSISSTSFALSSCQSYNGQINLTDSKGNTNASGTAFNGYTYGVVRSPGDTAWFTTPSFTVSIGNSRSVVLVAKDRCGKMQTKSWTNTSVPTVAANATISNLTCTGFDAAITGQTNLKNPTYCLLDNNGNAVAGKPCNSTGSFTNIPFGSYCIQITNVCYDTVFKRCFTQTKPAPTVDAAAATSNFTCTTFTATVTGKNNLINPQYCIYDASNNSACNNTGVFNNLQYGKYKIIVTDGCGGSPIQITVNGSKQVRNVDATVTTGSLTCSGFTATMGGASNMTSPTYCLLDSLGHQVSCNSTGIFTNIPYGKYCINTKDGCGDTTIQRCVTVTKPVPNGGTPNPSNFTCAGYKITVTGQANIYGGNYCLLDQNGNTILCNATGVFTNVPYGKVCVKVTDSCSGQVFTSCLTQTRTAPSVGPAVTSNLVCSGFTATVSNQQGFVGAPTACVYDQSGNLVGSCNTSGVFNNVPYGSYNIKMRDSCTGTVFTIPVSATKPAPTVNATVAISNQTCSGFTAKLSGSSNLSGVTFTLKTSSGTIVATNTTGVFNNLSYQNYCIYVSGPCIDVPIERCFTADPIAIDANISASPSCTENATDLSFTVTAGTGPYQVKVLDTLNNLITSASFSGSSTTIKSVPTLVSAKRYKIVISGLCGKPDTAFVTSNPSQLNRNYTINPECPSSAKANGSATLIIGITANLSGVNVKLVEQDGVAVSISYSNKSGSNYTFSNIDAGKYKIQYTFTSCSVPIFDSIVIPKYAFPSLSKSSAYQCDNNSFSVGAAVTGGIGPYTYEIIASSPSSPSIVTAPQSNPIFGINNNTQYNLIRLRAIDACGNSALNDVSVLPLANTIITATSNCIYQGSTLSTDVTPNATYTWYKKKSATDSTKLSSTTNSYTIATLTPADTGTYVVKTSVNAGCLTKLSYFHLDGVCPTVLPININLQGRATGAVNQLSWAAPANNGASEYEVQRSTENGQYVAIGTVAAGVLTADSTYGFADHSPGAGANVYRLRIADETGHAVYSNVVVIRGTTVSDVTIFPNPVNKVLNIHIKGEVNQSYQLSLFNIVGQPVWNRQVDNPSAPIMYQRGSNVPPGLYVLKVMNVATGASTTYKVHFE